MSDSTGTGRSAPGGAALPHEDSLRYEGWRVVAASSVGVFVSFASLLVYTFGVFLKPLAQEFSWSREAVSTAFGVAAVMVAISSPVLGMLFDRFGPRRVIVPSLVIFGGGFASLALLTPNLWHLYAIFAVLGLVANGTAQMAYSRAVVSWFHRRRGLALALMMCGGAVGAMVLPPVAQRLIDALGWRAASVVLGTMVLAIGLPAVLGFVRERPAATGGRRQAPGAPVSEGLRSRVFWILVIVLFIASIAQNGAIAHLAALLTDRGVPAASAAIAVSAMGGASLLGRLATGWLLDRYRAAVVSCVLLCLAAFGTFLLAGAHSLAVGALAAILIGFGMGGEADVTPYMLSRFFGLRSFSMLYGFTWTAYAMAGAIGPVLMGRVFDATGSYEALLVRLAAATLGAAALMLWVPREAPLRPEPLVARQDEPAVAG
ncbi:MAG TPA: MFS transporter [Vicinamibacterales bacterium]|nr:MFS transporter [Vicinamibacterales bacterium]